MRRQVYIDLGVNFGDTLDIFRQLDTRAEPRHVQTGWEVYGFECMPKTATYLEDLFRFKNGQGARGRCGARRPWARRLTCCASPV